MSDSTRNHNGILVSLALLGTAAVAYLAYRRFSGHSHPDAPELMRTAENAAKELESRLANVLSRAS